MIRVSFTLLSYWHRGDKEAALAYYTGKKTPATEEMELGLAYDTFAKQEITTHKRLPVEFGGLRLTDPVADDKKNKLECLLAPQVQLVTIPDCIDLPVFYEFKTGLTPAVDYAHSKQIGIYALAAQIMAVPLQAIRIVRYNPYSKKTDWHQVNYSDQLANETRQYILGVVPEIISYFEPLGIV